MPKNIVLCCDGTANEFAQDRTNVVRLFFTLRHDPRKQVAYYHPGLGTMEPSGALTTLARQATKLLGMAFGYGFEHDIADAYAFLMNNFRHGDHVYLFGFSRGAYTVRALAALLHLYGLIRPDNETLIPYAIRMMAAIGQIRAKMHDRSAMLNDYLSLAREFREHFGIRNCRPHFVGLWDTVSSVGWYEHAVRLPYTANNPDIKIARHAVAIDERRAFFRANLWHPTPHGGPIDLKQVWFPGTHSDVGGGFPERESGLSKITLQWMLEEAIEAGLLCHPERVDLILGGGAGYVAPDANAVIHDSMTGFWPLAELIPKRHYNWTTRKEERRPNLFRRRTIPSGALIHQAAYERGEDYARRLPANVARVPW